MDLKLTKKNIISEFLTFNFFITLTPFSVTVTSLLVTATTPVVISMANGKTSAAFFPPAVLALAAFAFCLHLNEGEATGPIGTYARVPGSLPSSHDEERGNNWKRLLEKDPILALQSYRCLRSPHPKKGIAARYQQKKYVHLRNKRRKIVLLWSSGGG